MISIEDPQAISTSHFLYLVGVKPGLLSVALGARPPIHTSELNSEKLIEARG